MISWIRCADMGLRSIHSVLRCQPGQCVSASAVILQARAAAQGNPTRMIRTRSSPDLCPARSSTVVLRIAFIIPFIAAIGVSVLRRNWTLSYYHRYYIGLPSVISLTGA